jgi:hypothetical protein
LPMCMQVMTAFAFSAGNGIVGTSIRLRGRGDKRVLTPLECGGILEAVPPSGAAAGGEPWETHTSGSTPTQARRGKTLHAPPVRQAIRC